MLFAGVAKLYIGFDMLYIYCATLKSSDKVD